VQDTLSAQPGVEQVSVDFETKTATVVPGSDFDPKAAMGAFEGTQFEVTQG